MSRVARARRLQSLQLHLAPYSHSNRAPFAAVYFMSTTRSAQNKNTEWVRSKLWKGEAPGPEDPYTQRTEPENVSNLPDEALEAYRSIDRTPKELRDTRLVMPPKRTEAATEDELKSTDPSYVPAEDASELEEIAIPKTWWDEPGHWGEESQFKGFASSNKVVNGGLIEMLLRRALIEVLALKEAGVFSEWAAKRWRPGSRAELDQALSVGIQMNDGRAVLNGDAGAVVASVMAENEAEVDQMAMASMPSVEEATELIKGWDPSWLNVPLDDEMKFALRKRLYQLSGRLTPDSKLAAARTIKHVLAIATQADKPPKLAEILETQSELPKIPNVTLHDRKVGPIDKERAVGRWKIIEEELQKRGLPVSGSVDLPKNKERDWLLGKE